MPDTHYVHPRLAAIYDRDSGWSEDRDFYLALARDREMRILDLGCGTGLIARAYAARGHHVTGVDPAEAMLEAGRHEPHGEAIEWVHGFAQTYASDTRFDLIIMTGNAFQVLLNDVDVLATFATVRGQLAPGGIAVFESRNPAIDWAEIWDKAEIVHRLPDGDVRITRHFLAWNGDRMTFEHRYRFPDETLVSRSVLRFMTAEEIDDRLDAAGLRIERLMGDWSGEPFDPASSEEMVFRVGAAD
ncbi:class I SAM-dependent methyltransferase [Bauldia sp.]|uniref:class I SAM-dependent methyltransferase n=1 Tax=Bauldia sp. TaxID=2575872 RepID=UPI003BAA3785